MILVQCGNVTHLYAVGMVQYIIDHPAFASWFDKDVLVTQHSRHRCDFLPEQTNTMFVVGKYGL